MNTANSPEGTFEPSWEAVSTQRVEVPPLVSEAKEQSLRHLGIKVAVGGLATAVGALAWANGLDLILDRIEGSQEALPTTIFEAQKAGFFWAVPGYVSFRQAASYTNQTWKAYKTRLANISRQ